MSTNIKELKDAITIVENFIGLRLKIVSEHIQYKEFLRITVIAGIIRTKLALWRPILLVMQKSDALDILEQYMHNRINDESILMLKFSDYVYDQIIEVDDVLLNLAAVRPEDDPKVLYGSILGQKQETAYIKLVQAMNKVEDTTLHVESLRKIRSAPSFDFPKDVKAFIAKSNIKNTNLIHRISLAIHLIRNFFNKRGIEYELKMGLFEDPEEDWKALKLTIFIRRNLQHMYETIEGFTAY